MPKAKTVKSPKVKEIKTPETPETVVAVDEARVREKARLEDMRINSPHEYSDYLEKLSK